VRRQDFEKRVVRLWERIPPRYRAGASNLVLIVEDLAPEEVLEETGCEDALELLGYYSGWPLPERSFELSGELPDRIFLYQKAIETAELESGDPLDKILYETLLHELAHHLGFSEADLDPIEMLWAGPEDEPAS